MVKQLLQKKKKDVYIFLVLNKYREKKYKILNYYKLVFRQMFLILITLLRKMFLKQKAWPLISWLFTYTIPNFNLVLTFLTL